jgi:RHS repeat-associated protein
LIQWFHYQVSAASRSTGDHRTDFAYDGLGRLLERLEYSPSPAQSPVGNWTLNSETHYIYDGWRVIQERDYLANTPTVSYTRGNDLSGTVEGAGGIGGLLARSHNYSSGNFTIHNYYFADGNGNVTYMLNSSQAMVASYRYDPFGNTNSSSGTLADANLYRFSSKETHANSGMYYYGFRFYDPNLQRWINRDPIEEFGGINLYSFVQNLEPNAVDVRGLDIIVNGSGVPILVDGNPGTGHGAGGFEYAVCPPDNKPHGGKNPLPCYATPAEAWAASTNSTPSTNFIYDIDGWYNPTGTRDRLRGDDKGPTTTIGRDKAGKPCIKDRSGRPSAIWRFIWR